MRQSVVGQLGTYRGLGCPPDSGHSQRAGGGGRVISMKGLPVLKKLETDPRYKASLRKMKLPE